MPRDLLPDGYDESLRDVKARIQQAQMRAALSVNRELVLLYWRIGREILRRQREQGWGAKVIDRLARDLRAAFPEMKGFSPRNLKYMRAFAEAYPDEQFVQQVAAQLPWFHLCVLLDKLKAPDQRLWYAHEAIQHGWSRNVLAHHIDTHLYARQGQAVTNFTDAMPTPQSDLAQQTLKDPYIFDFLSLGTEAHERDLERALLAHVRGFLLEMGTGFAFVGSQYHLEIDGHDFYLDLLFYHLRLRCFVVVDLKIGDFAPEHAGKMNFYLAAVNDLLRHPEDQPSIGIILCRTKSRLIAEYALKGIHTPMGISSYQLTASLPEALQSALPGIEALEASLADAAMPSDDTDE
ncbi:MAG: DUF1016 family protein [Ktedonobacterales bacterium]|nr:DUF1016 family protein [Ktedonobacterales bacterium]